MNKSEPAWVVEAKKLTLVVDGKTWKWVDGDVPPKTAVDSWRRAQGHFPIDEGYLDFVRRHGTATVLGLQFYELEECGTAFGMSEKPKSSSAAGVGVHIFARVLPMRGFMNAAFSAEANLLQRAKTRPAFSYTIWSKWLDGGPSGIPDKPDFDSFMAWWVDVMKQKAAAKKKPARKAASKAKRKVAPKVKAATKRKR